MNSFNWLFKTSPQKNKMRTVILFVLLVIIIWRTFLFKNMVDTHTTVGPLDFVAKMMNGDTLLLIGLPLYLFYANSFTSIKNNFELIRLHSRSFIWRNEIIAFCLSAFIFSFLSVMITYISSGILLKNFTNYWRQPTSDFVTRLNEISPHLSSQSVLYTTPSVLFIYILFTAIGFFCLGLIFAIVKYLFNHTAIVFVLFVVLIILDSYAAQGKMISPYITLDYMSFLNPISIIGNILITLGITLLCILIGQILLNRRDFILMSKKGAK